jgi:hypothetical protein
MNETIAPMNSRAITAARSRPHMKALAITGHTSKAAIVAQVMAHVVQAAV